MIQGRICENRNEFAHHLDLALKGVPSSQGIVKETVMMTLGLAPRVTEAVTSDMVAGWFTSVAQGAFESQYAEQTTTWEKFASTEALPSFRPTQLYELDHDIDATLLRDNGGEVVVPQTMPRIPELTPYPTFGYRASGRWVEVHKEGVRLQMSWEAFINDNWNIIAQFPKDAAFLASRTVDAAVYGALFSLDAAAPGFNTNIIADANATVLQSRTADGVYVLRDVPKNSPLTFEALCAAIWQVRHTKVNGRYIQVPKFVLLVPPTLRPMADMVTSMTSIEHKEKDAAGATSNKTILSTTPTAGVEVVESDMVGQLDPGPGRWPHRLAAHHPAHHADGHGGRRAAGGGQPGHVSGRRGAERHLRFVRQRRHPVPRPHGHRRRRPAHGRHCRLDGSGSLIDAPPPGCRQRPGGGVFHRREENACGVQHKCE